MSLYEGIAFKGNFRGYQQKVLNQAKQFLAKGKVNMVAAPGSGKTILGLEFIRSLGEACLIISPSEATIAHWEKRLREDFLTDTGLSGEIFSTDLEKPKVINAITYAQLAESMEAYASDGEKKSIKLRRMIRERRINAICLDEPHHLKEEYINALQQLQELLEKDEKFIYLTSTPPCEYEEAEYKHFYKICGEIDVSILASELVAEKVLCPHQDYIYFNIPSEEEVALFREHMERVQSALEEIGKLEQVRSALEELGNLECVQVSIKTGKPWKSTWAFQCNKLYDKINSSIPEAYIPILQLLQYYKLRIKQYKAKRLAENKVLPPVRIKDMQVALQFLTDQYDILGEHRKPILQVLRKYSLYEKKRVRLVPDELMQRALTASVGKLNSIRDIVNGEYQTLGKDLRLLVFTEGIHQNAGNLAHVGTSEEFQTVDAISIFETLRRLDKEINIAVLTKDMLILPIIGELQGTMVRTEPLGDTGYAKVEFFDSMIEAMDMVKEMFQEGKLQVFIGDQTLLNEEWEESPINSLILPGFSRNFSLANAMRGIALYSSTDNPKKSVNIWHLATVSVADRIEDFSSHKIHREYLESYDLEMVKARFQLFMESGYETGEVERTIKSIILSDSAFKNDQIQRMNRKMLEYSADRGILRD